MYAPGLSELANHPDAACHNRFFPPSIFPPSTTRKFEFEYAGTMPEEVLMSVTAHPKYGVPLCVKRRQERQQQQQAAPAQQQAAEAARARW